MAINYQRTIMQVLVILILVGANYLSRRFFNGRRRQMAWWALGTLLLFGLASWNLGWYWFAYPIAVWMVFALLLLVLQTVHHHEFLYRRYWPPFWRYSLYLAVISFIISIFSGMLPLI